MIRNSSMILLLFKKTCYKEQRKEFLSIGTIFIPEDHGDMFLQVMQERYRTLVV